MANQKKEDFSVKEIKPSIRARMPFNGPTTSHNLVEEMSYLYVKIEKGRLEPVDSPLRVELINGNYRGETEDAMKSRAGEYEWEETFAFTKSRLQDRTVQVLVKGVDGVVVSKFSFGVSEASERVPPNPPVEPQWCQLVEQNGSRIRGGLLMAFWTGTQVDEAYNTALHSDVSAPLSREGQLSIRRREYITPRLWYLRVEVIAAQDLVINGIKNRVQPAQIFVKASVLLPAVGETINFTTKACRTKTPDTKWNEELMFVVAEPFDATLVVKVFENQWQESLERREIFLGGCEIPLSKVGKRNDRSPVASLWYDLKVMRGEENTARFASKINMRVSLDGGYHVIDEPMEFLSDRRPSAKVLWTPPIGIFELGIISASGLSPIHPKTTVNTFCVAKYGPKWVRTRTAVDNCSPKWNEQFKWEVYDHCTVITIAVFENKYFHQGFLPDWAIGKVRIRLSDLQLGKVYTNSHPLVKLERQGVRKGGELQLAYRFSSPCMLDVYSRYTAPLLPTLHYKLPLSELLIQILRHQAVELTVSRLQRAKSPLSKEVVQYVLEGNNNFSLRRAKANLLRCKKLLDDFSFWKQRWDQLRNWSNNLWHSGIFLACHIVACWLPGLALSSMFFILCGLGAWGYWKRPRQLPHMDTELSLVYSDNSVDRDKIVEEFDNMETIDVPDIVIRMRYERLRAYVLNVQTALGAIATTGEKVQCLLSWRDRRATLVVLIFCFCIGLVFYFVALDLRILLFCAVLWMFRGRYFRGISLPSIFENFILRMPSKVDSML